MLLHLARRLSPDDIRQPNPGGIDFIHNVLQVLFSVFAITLLKQDICLYCVSSHTLLNQSLQLHRVFYTHLHTLSLYLIWISTALSTGNSIHYHQRHQRPKKHVIFQSTPALYIIPKLCSDPTPSRPFLHGTCCPSATTRRKTAGAVTIEQDPTATGSQRANRCVEPRSQLRACTILNSSSTSLIGDDTSMDGCEDILWLRWISHLFLFAIKLCILPGVKRFGKSYAHEEAAVV